MGSALSVRDTGCRAPPLGACEPLKGERCRANASSRAPSYFGPWSGPHRSSAWSQLPLHRVRCQHEPAVVPGERRPLCVRCGAAGVHLLPQEWPFLCPSAPKGFSSLKGVIGYQLLTDSVHRCPVSKAPLGQRRGQTTSWDV